jgi:hypothetical protein
MATKKTKLLWDTINRTGAAPVKNELKQEIYADGAIVKFLVRALNQNNCRVQVEFVCTYCADADIDGERVVDAGGWDIEMTASQRAAGILAQKQSFLKKMSENWQDISLFESLLAETFIEENK